MVFTDCGRAYLTGYVASAFIVEEFEYFISVKGFHIPFNRSGMEPFTETLYRVKHSCQVP